MVPPLTCACSRSTRELHFTNVFVVSLRIDCGTILFPDTRTCRRPSSSPTACTTAGAWRRFSQSTRVSHCCSFRFACSSPCINQSHPSAADSSIWWHHCIASVANCTAAQVRTLNLHWQNDFLQRILRQPKFWSTGNGGFLHSLIMHCGESMEGSGIWNARVSIGGVRMNVALGQWFNDLRTTSHYIGCTLNELPPYQCADP